MMYQGREISTAELITLFALFLAAGLLIGATVATILRDVPRADRALYYESRGL